MAMAASTTVHDVVSLTAEHSYFGNFSTLVITARNERGDLIEICYFGSPETLQLQYLGARILEQAKSPQFSLVRLNDKKETV
jgi:hypothetical protein